MTECSDWRPATAVEDALRAARERGDAASYLAVLAETDLFLPVPDDHSAGAAPFAWPLLRLPDESTAVLAFTSEEALSYAVPHGRRYQAATFVDLAEAWPDPAWRLAVDPGLPIAAHLTGPELSVAVATVFAPDNDVEAAMVRARRAEDPDALLEALLGAELHLPCRPDSPSRDLTDPEFPWWREGEESDVMVPAFTSERRLHGRLGVAHGHVDFGIVDLLLLVESWPDDRWSLVVNPGSPMEATVGGHMIAEIDGWVRDASSGPGGDEP